MDLYLTIFIMTLLAANMLERASGQFDFSFWLENGSENTNDVNGTLGSCPWEDTPKNGYSFRPCATGLCKDARGTYQRNGTVRITGCDKHFVLTQGRNKDICVNGSWSTTGHHCLQCGESQWSFNPHEELILIRHGRNSSLGQFPWMAAVYSRQDGGKWAQICGGTLVSATLVLSASHCFVLREKHLKTEDVRIGLGKLFSSFYINESSAMISTVSEVVVPERYLGSEHLFDLDIALVVLSSGVTTSVNIMPACVDWRAAMPPASDETGYLAGYGITEEGISSSTLKWALQKYLNYETCRSLITAGDRKYVTHDKFCVAQLRDSEADGGDSGGGLTFVREGVHYVYGILSTKLLGDDARRVRLFTNLLNEEHRAWLQSHWHKPSVIGSDCTSDTDCTSNRSCDARTCVDPCLRAQCTSECRVVDHSPSCVCQDPKNCNGGETSTNNEEVYSPPDYEQGPGDVCRQDAQDLWTCRRQRECPRALIALRASSTPWPCNHQDNTGNPVVCCQPSLDQPPKQHQNQKMCQFFSQSVNPQDAACDVYKEPPSPVGLPRGLKHGELPHRAFVTRENYSKSCFGSLISDRFIITDARCASNNGPFNKARLGVDVPNDRHREHQNYDVIATFVHPEYNPHLTRQEYNSVALVRLGSSVQFSQYVRPICLYSAHLFPGTHVTIVGKYKDSNCCNFMKTSTSVMPRKECNIFSKAAQREVDDKAFVCVRTNQYNKTKLLYYGLSLEVKLKDHFCMYGLAGITGFTNTARDDHIGFCRISHYLHWIEDIVWPH